MSKNGNPKRIKFYKDKLGQHQYTLASLRERIEDQFSQETQGRADILAELDTRAKRIQAVTEAADYVLAVEYVQLPPEEKRQIIEEAVANLFYFGALDSYLRDPEITELTIEGPLEIAVRRGFGELKAVDSVFENLPQLEALLLRLIAPAGGVLRSDQPFLEVGIMVHDRPARLSLIAPPISPMYSVQLRLHSAAPLGLDDLIPHVLPPAAAELLAQCLRAGRGLIVTGEAGVGKTTLIAALLNAHPPSGRTAVVERATEMQLSGEFIRLAAVPPKADADGVDFAAQISEAVRHRLPQTLVIDEIRGDESGAFWEALTADHITQSIIAFRGTPVAARLHSALSMVIRKHQPGIDAAVIDQTLLSKLPFVLALHRHRADAPPRLSFLGQWAVQGGGLVLEPLVSWSDEGEAQRTPVNPRL